MSPLPRARPRPLPALRLIPRAAVESHLPGATMERPPDSVLCPPRPLPPKEDEALGMPSVWWVREGWLAIGWVREGWLAVGWLREV